jgi:hypothetical protein
MEYSFIVSAHDFFNRSGWRKTDLRYPRLMQHSMNIRKYSQLSAIVGGSAAASNKNNTFLVQIKVSQSCADKLAIKG